jgi:putative peptidoglycan lipid II flippase
MYVSIASIAINAGMGYSLVRIIGMGHSGLALATSAVALFSFFVLFWLMKVRIGGVYGRRLRSVILKVTLASAVMGAAVWGSSRFIQSLAGIAPMARLIDLAITIPLGIVILYLVCRALRVEELAMAVTAVGGPIARRFSALNAKLGS